MSEGIILYILMGFAIGMAAFIFARRGDEYFFRNPRFLRVIALIYWVTGVLTIREKLLSLTNPITGNNAGKALAFENTFDDRTGIILCILAVIVLFVSFFVKDKKMEEEKLSAEKNQNSLRNKIDL